MSFTLPPRGRSGCRIAPAAGACAEPVLAPDMVHHHHPSRPRRSGKSCSTKGHWSRRSSTASSTADAPHHQDQTAVGSSRKDEQSSRTDTKGWCLPMTELAQAQQIRRSRSHACYRFSTRLEWTHPSGSPSPTCSQPPEACADTFRTAPLGATRTSWLPPTGAMRMFPACRITTL